MTDTRGTRGAPAGCYPVRFIDFTKERPMTTKAEQWAEVSVSRPGDQPVEPLIQRVLQERDAFMATLP